jgi:hypothetical protein
MEPPPSILLCRFRAGGIAGQLPHYREPEWFGPGDVAAFGVFEGVALEGEIRQAQYDILALDRRIFDDVAASSAGSVPAARVAHRCTGPRRRERKVREFQCSAPARSLRLRSK